jgi:hypothetical protein
MFSIADRGDSEDAGAHTYRPIPAHSKIELGAVRSPELERGQLGEECAAVCACGVLAIILQMLLTYARVTMCVSGVVTAMIISDCVPQTT